MKMKIWQMISHRDGDIWSPIIDLDNGQHYWEKELVNLYMKICDEGYYLLDGNKILFCQLFRITFLINYLR
jgi:hypothetical protein